MSIKCIIFDKDGTLMDFDAFWGTVSIHAVTELLAELHLSPNLMEPLLASIGYQNGTTDVQGVLSWGTYRLMGEAMHDALTEAGIDCDREEVVRLTYETYHKHADKGEIRPACDNIGEVLKNLLRQDIALAVVTTDGPVITRQCLEKMDIGPLFSAICTADGVLPPKPDPYCIEAICEQFRLTKEEIVMVGDTMTDVQFARNGGIRVIGVAKTEEGRAFLAEKADIAVPDISHVAAVLAEWEK